MAFVRFEIVDFDIFQKVVIHDSKQIKSIELNDLTSTYISFRQQSSSSATKYIRISHRRILLFLFLFLFY